MKAISLSDGRLPFKLADVRPCNERFFARASDNKYSHRIIITELIKGSNAFPVDLIIEGIELIGTIDSKDGDLASSLQGDRFEWHVNSFNAKTQRCKAAKNRLIV